MPEFSNYPNQIDTTIELPKATDNVTAFKAELFNRLRSAVIAIEKQLGIQPSSTFSTVRARLDALERGLVSGQATVIGAVTVQHHGKDVDAFTNTLDFVDDLNVIHPSSGKVQIGVTKSKIRVFRDKLAYVGAVAGFPQIVVWNAISPILNNINAGLINNNTQIASVKDGTYDITGQLTLRITAGNINKITINVIKNDTIIHTIIDDSTIWNVGQRYSFGFSVKTELSAYSPISINWSHDGDEGSTTALDCGDNLSWLSLIKIQ